MKTRIISILTLMAAVFSLSSCSDDSTEGLTRITAYPTIELNGDAFVVVAKGSTYTDPGWVSLMNGEDVSEGVTVDGTVDTNTSGYYTLTYKTVKNSDGFGASATRKVAVVDTTSPYEGVYVTQATSYRLREGAEVAYGSTYPFLILDNGDGTLDVEDLLGGWYCQRAGYGSNYSLGGTITVAPDGTVTCSKSFLVGWGDSHDDFSGTYDATTGTFTIKTVYAGMDFVQTWVKYVIE